jgi:hypothetical protein
MKIPKFNYSVREKTVADIMMSLPPFKTFLNVGFHNWEDPRRHWWIKICEENQINWKIVEIFIKNVEDAISAGCPVEKIQIGNIEDVENLPQADCLLYWHGPEHNKKEEFLKILPHLEKKYQTLIFGMPLGHEPQGIAYGNIFEVHVSHWQPEEWLNLGYAVSEIHDHQKYPHITVHKIQK